MERVLQNYDFLLELAESNYRKQREMLGVATREQVLSVIDCVKLCSAQATGVPEIVILTKTRRWKRAVLLLKKHCKLLSPILLSILCTLFREVAHYMYTME